MPWTLRSRFIFIKNHPFHCRGKLHIPRFRLRRKLAHFDARFSPQSGKTTLRGPVQMCKKPPEDTPAAFIIVLGPRPVKAGPQ